MLTKSDRFRTRPQGQSPKPYLERHDDGKLLIGKRVTVESKSVYRSDAVRLLQGLSLYKADTWSLDKIQTYLTRVEDIGEAEDLRDWRLRQLFQDLVEARADGIPVVVESDPDILTRRRDLLRHPQEIQLPRKPKRKERASLKKPGIVSTTIDMLLAATERTPTTKPLILKELIRLYGPDTEYKRPIAGMRNTLSGLATWIRREEHARRGIQLHQSARGIWATITPLPESQSESDLANGQ